MAAMHNQKKKIKLFLKGIKIENKIFFNFGMKF